MEDFLLDDTPTFKQCRIWVKMWLEVNDRGQAVTKHLICKGQMIKTVISETPHITQWKCNVCGNGWQVKNGFKYPLPNEDDLYQSEDFDFL
jgi:hypothetical protein